MSKGISLPVVQSGLEASIQQGVKNVGKINIPATIDPSAFKNLAQPLGRVSGLATEFEKSIAASNARVLAFGASVGIINGVQNAFSDLVRTGIEVQKTLADIAAISGQGGKQLSQFGDALFDIGKTTGQTFKTAAQAALEFSRQGLSVEETLKRTTDALTLTRFTTLNAAEAVDVLTAAANSFSETGITTAQIINKLVAVDTKFAVSAEDLANGLARAGSIAQEVGVNFDQLNAAITIAQERTARGGAVIGNALKTIFTRIRSDETVQALRSIGVESLNAQGQLKGAIPLLEEVAQKIQGLSGGERVQILEAIASKYNINILSALLNDLNGANSKFSEAVAVSAGASNQAYERQIELNKTLAAQINNATVSVTQLFNKLSEIGVTDSLATLLKFVSDLINGFNKIVDSEGLGGNIAKGLIKGISDVFFTVGLPIIGAIFIKLTRDIAQFGVESLKTILGINQQVRERQALEQAVVNTLIQDQQVMASILALSGNRAKQEEYLLGVYNRQLNALQQVKTIAATVTPALMSGGLTATSGRIERRGAGGYLPAQEAADVRRGVGGASPSSRVVSIPNFAFGGGKRGTMIANTSEYIVPNFANGGSAIFNKDMARAYGLPAGAKKISAASGYVPNFVGGGGATWRTHYYVNAQGNKITQPKVWDSLSETEKKQYSRRESSQDLTGKTLSALHPGGAVMLLPTQEMADEVNDKSMRQGIKPKEFKDVADFVKFRAYGFSGSRVKNQVKSEGANEGVAIANIAENIKKVITNEGARVVNLFKPLTKTPISGNEFEKLYDEKGGAAGAAAGVAGSIFEAAMDYSFNNKKSRAAQEAIAAAEANNITFDVLNFKQARTLKAAFGASGSTEAFADYKISPERARTFADQIIKNNVFAKASSGFIPNFAAGSPLGDAINREMAAGVSPNKIRITQDGRLRNAGNPGGLAVINTRDEPNGRIPNFANQTENINKVFADKKIQIENKSLLTTNKLMASFIGLQLATSTLQSTFQDTESVIGKTLTTISKIGSSIAGYGTLGSMLGESLKGRGGILGKLSGGAGVAGLAIGGVLGTISSISDYLDEQQRIADTKRKTAGQSDIANLLTQNAGLGEEGQREALRAARKNIETDLAQTKTMMSPKYGPELMKKDLAKIANLQNQINNYKAKELELTTAISLKNLKDSQEREAAQKREKEELNSRIALEKTRISLNEAFAQNQLIFEKERNNRQLEYLRIEVSLSEFQKTILRNREELTRLEEKEAELNAESVKNIIEKIRGTSQLTSTDALRVSMLESELKAGKKIQDVQKTINDLRIQGVSSLPVILMNELSNLKIAKDKVGEELRYTEQRQKNVLLGQSDLSAQQLLLQITSDRLEREREIFDIRLESGVDLNLTENQRELLKLREKIASQAFATPEQEAQLARLTLSTEQYSNVLKANVDFLSKRNSIFRTTQKDFASIFDEAGPLKFLSQQTRDNLKNSILSATDLSDIKGNLQMNFEDIDSMLADIDMSGISEEEIQSLRENFSKTISAVYDNLLTKLTTANAQMDYAEQKRNTAIDQTRQLLTYEEKINIFREKNGLAATGFVRAFSEIDKQAKSFSETLSYDTTLAFRDGLRDAMSAAISQTDDLGSALQNVAMNFLKTMQSQFLNQAAGNITTAIGKGLNITGMAKGGLVTGGSGYRDDVPRMLTGGEFVMRKSAVQKYGVANLAKMNNGGIFLPGVRGGGAISGYDALRAFANQTTTSGATDVLRGGGSSAFINLEDQSSRLSRFALLGDDTINQEIRSAQEQGLNIITEREKYRTQQRKAFQQQLISTVASAALSAGIGKLVGPLAAKGSATGLGLLNQAAGKTQFLANAKPFEMPKAYGGMIRRYASGGPVDDIPALLMSGEYVMNRGATSRYGRRFLDSMNQGRAPRFADGGEVGASTTTTESNAKMMGDVSININVSGQGSQTESQGNTSQGGIDYKKMSERIKAVVLETINEEKRLGGALRTR